MDSTEIDVSTRFKNGEVCEIEYVLGKNQVPTPAKTRILDANGVILIEFEPPRRPVSGTKDR